MGLIFIRTIIVFITLLIIMRLMGKRQIGEMQPFELVITLLIAELACIPMADTSIPLLYGIVAILTIYFLHQIVCLLDLGAKPMKALLSGSPSIVLNKNGIDDTQLKKNNLDVSDLYEANGSFSALPKAEYADMQSSLPVILIDEGKFDEKNIGLTKKSKSYFLDVLKEHGCKNEKQILIMTVDGDGKVYLQKKGERYTVFELKWEEKIW